MTAFIILLLLIAFSAYIEFVGFGPKCPRCGSHKTLKHSVDNVYYCWVCDNSW